MSEKTKVTKLTDVELAKIQNLKNEMLLVTAQAERALAEAKNVELRYQNLIQQLYLKNGLDINCKIEEKDGSVIWPEEEKEVKEESEEINGEVVAS